MVISSRKVGRRLTCTCFKVALVASGVDISHPHVNLDVAPVSKASKLRPRSTFHPNRNEFARKNCGFQIQVAPSPRMDVGTNTSQHRARPTRRLLRSASNLHPSYCIYPERHNESQRTHTAFVPCKISILVRDHSCVLSSG